MKQFLTFLTIFILSGCSQHNMSIDSHIVESNKHQFKSKPIENKEICIVISPELSTYIFEKKAYSAMGGSMFPDTLYFDIGQNLSLELSNLIETITSKECKASNIEKALKDGNIIIQPEIIECSLDLPALRFKNVVAKITVKYSFYDSKGKLIYSENITGLGTHRLIARKENYNLAFQVAINDLLLKTTNIITNTIIKNEM
jgi:hypothetical protein